MMLDEQQVAMPGPDYRNLSRELETIRRVANKLMRGAVLTKHRRGVAQRRRIWVSPDCAYIHWGRVNRRGQSRGPSR